jgi:hypothetical protein
MVAHHEQNRRSKDTVSVNDSNVKDEAIAEGTTPERIQKHGDRQRPHKKPTSNERSTTPEQHPSRHLVDGYALTEGEDYAQPQRDEVHGYDPAHSGVRHAQNKPGAPTNAPGRDEGTSWAEQVQNGAATDVPRRRNPAD